MRSARLASRISILRLSGVKRSGIPIHQDPRLRECDYGRLNGAPVTELAPQRVDHVDEPWPDGESMVRARIMEMKPTVPWRTEPVDATFV